MGDNEMIMNDNEPATLDQTTDTSLPTDGQQPDIVQPDQDAAQQTPQAQQQPQAPAQAQPQAQPGNPQWWKPDLFQLKYRGAQVSPRDYKHAVSLMQKGWSYQQAMSEVNRQKQEIDGMRAKYQEYDGLEKAFRENPAFAQEFRRWYAETMQRVQSGTHPLQQQQQQPGQQQFQVPPELAQELRQMREWRQTLENQQADNEVRDEIESLKGAFPGKAWDQMTESGHQLLWDVLNHAKSGRFPSLMAAARDYFWETEFENAKMAGAQQVQQTRMARAKQGVVSSGAPKAAPAANPLDLRKMSYDDIDSLAKRELNLTS